MTPRLENVKHFAEEAFKNHVLEPKVTEGEVRSWLIREPGTGIYLFWVTLLPHTIIVSGDVGDAILNVSNNDPLPWIRYLKDNPTDYHYVASKIRTGESRTFDARLAEEFLKDYVEGSGEEDPEEIEKLKKKVASIRQNWDSDDESGNSFYGACYKHEVDTDGCVSDYPADRYWTVECLRTFARLLP